MTPGRVKRISYLRVKEIVYERVMQSEREQWDRKYSEGSHADLTPDPLLVQAYDEFIKPLLAPSERPADSPCAALDIAGGVGRHAIWLAVRDWKVSLIDISPVGIELARQNAQKASVKIETETQDLSTMLWPVSRYDLVLVFFYLERALLPAMQAALRPGGLLVYKTYTRDQPRLSGGKGPTHPMHLLDNNELLRAFAGMQVLYYRETVEEKGVAELVARKTS